MFVFAVTPCVGVWIEIADFRVIKTPTSSLPVWECGLKFVISVDGIFLGTSLPVWECGLKS